MPNGEQQQPGPPKMPAVKTLIFEEGDYAYQPKPIPKVPIAGQQASGGMAAQFEALESGLMNDV